MDKWRNKVALVTGASSGIGEAITRILAESGMIVIGIARRYEKIADLSSKLKESGMKGKLIAMRCDLRNEEDILEIFDEIINDFGGIDLLVNNAGVLASSSLLQGKTKEWRDIYEVNVLAMSICTREFYKQLKRRKVETGHIINNCSLLGHIVPNIPFAHFYMGTKFAIKALTEGFRQELRTEKSQIRMTEISSGFVETEMLKPHRAMFSNIKILKPKDIAEVVVNILSAPLNVEINEVILRPIDEEM